MPFGTPLSATLCFYELMPKEFGKERIHMNESTFDDMAVNRYAEQGNVWKLRFLLFFLPKLANAKDKRYDTPLHLAAEKGHLKVVKLLLGKGARSELNMREQYPIHLAAEKGHMEIAELLIATGSPVRAADMTKTTPLHLAVLGGHVNLVNLLLAKGADVNAKDKEGATPLIWAAHAGHKEIVELLITKGADVNTRDTFNRMTALGEATAKKHHDIVELLRARGAHE